MYATLYWPKAYSNIAHTDVYNFYILLMSRFIGYLITQFMRRFGRLGRFAR